MKQNISLKQVFLPKINDPTLDYDLCLAAIQSEPHLIEKEDYMIIGSDCYLRLNAALYLLGRFEITNVWNFTEDFIHLCQEEKRHFTGFNDKNLPDLATDEREWLDNVTPIIKGNAKFLDLEFNRFLARVYKQMNVNFAKEEGEYLERINMPNVKIAKLQIVARKKELRIEFEDAMNRVMTCARFK